MTYKGRSFSNIMENVNNVCKVFCYKTVNKFFVLVWFFFSQNRLKRSLYPQSFLCRLHLSKHVSLSRTSTWSRGQDTFQISAFRVWLLCGPPWPQPGNFIVSFGISLLWELHGIVFLITFLGVSFTFSLEKKGGEWNPGTLPWPTRRALNLDTSSSA